MECQFCGENLKPLYEVTALDEVAFCPRCRAAVTFTTDISDVRRLLAEAVLKTDYVSWDEAQKIDVVIVPDVDVLLSEADGEEEIARVHLVVGWDPNELLPTSEVARILGVSQERVPHLIAEGKFPHAVRMKPKCPRSRRGHWRIPRRDVADWMRRRRRKT